MPDRKGENEWIKSMGIKQEAIAKLYHKHILHNSSISADELAKLITETFTSLSDNKKKLLERAHNRLSPHNN